MNPVGEEGNISSNLFDKVPAKRAGNENDIAGAIIYLTSTAGVSIPIMLSTFSNKDRLTSMASLSALMGVAYFWQMDNNNSSTQDQHLHT